VDFASKQAPKGVRRATLRKVLNTSFQQRRKMLRQSLKPLLKEIGGGFTLPEEWATKRPQQLTPEEFVELTKLLYGEEEDKIAEKAWRNAGHGV
ncbi:unnamed protein product, partial [Heterosigma akashiwo]